MSSDGAGIQPKLDEVLAAFQKSLSRAWQQSQTVSRQDKSIKAGEKPLFTVEALEVELRVGVDVVATATDVVRINFDNKLPERSVIKFRVEMKPLEPEE